SVSRRGIPPYPAFASDELSGRPTWSGRFDSCGYPALPRLGCSWKAEPLPHLICSRPMFIGGCSDEANPHGGAQPVGCGDLVPVLVDAMERHCHLRLAPEVRIRLLAMSATTIDRALRDVRQRAGRSTPRKAPPSAAIRRSVPVRTFDGWDNPPPGFVEADLVS